LGEHLTVEKGKQLSFDAASITVPNSVTGGSDRIDLPMRAFAGGYYNNLRALYDHLGVRYRAQPFVFAFSQISSNAPIGSLQEWEAKPYFTHGSNNHRLPPLKPKGQSMYAYIVETVYLMFVYAYFTLCCVLIKPRSGCSRSKSTSPSSSTSASPYFTACETLEEYLVRIRIPRYFTTHYILPLLSSVATCPHEALLQFPACDVTGYKSGTNGQQHYTLMDGVGEAQGKLVDEIEDVRLSAHVLAVEPQSNKVKIQWRHTEDTHCLDSSFEEFDKVVLAISPDVVGKIFKPLNEMMGNIPTMRVESMVHTDDRVIRSEIGSVDGGSLNSQALFLRTCDGKTESYHVQPSGTIVTTCPFSAVKPKRIIHSSKFTRVLRTTKSRAIVNEIFSNDRGACYTEKSHGVWRNGDGNVWLAGGWCWDGMVLLEGCVISAFRAAEALGIQPAEILAATPLLSANANP
jgi:hypothetical protein